MTDYHSLCMQSQTEHIWRIRWRAPEGSLIYGRDTGAPAQLGRERGRPRPAGRHIDPHQGEHREQHLASDILLVR